MVIAFSVNQISYYLLVSRKLVYMLQYFLTLEHHTIGAKAFSDVPKAESHLLQTYSYHTHRSRNLQVIANF